jgi:SAM-dependent methyltransferase
MSSRPCPLCASSESAILGEQRYCLESESTLPELTEIVACTNCGFVFARSDSTADDYRAYYASQTRYESTVNASGSGEYALDEKRIRELVDLLTEALPLEANILDIGAAKGGVLKELRRRGYLNLYAMDPSDVCVQSIKALGIEAGRANLEDQQWPFDPRQFDLIILSHVLEHVFDISDCFKKVQRRLKKKGKIYIEVPDASRYSTTGFPAFYFFDPEHINHFDLPAFERLAAIHTMNIQNSVSRELNVGAVEPYPALGAFLIASSSNTYTGTQSEFSSLHIGQYMNDSQSLLASSKNYSRLTELAENASSVVIWGAGSYCRRLLANTPLADTTLLAIIDNDTGKQGKKLAGVEIYPSEEGLLIAKKHGATLVIAIAVNSDEIITRLKEETDNLDILVL